MANKTIQLLRNTATVYADYKAALAGLKTKLGASGEGAIADGQPILARYKDAKNNERTLLGIKSAAGYEIFDNEGASADIQAAIAALDATVSQAAAADNGQLALSVTETDGVITAISGSIAAETYDAYGAASTAETNAKVYTDGKITALNKAASAENGQVVTTVSEANGVVSETKANVKDLQLGGYAKDTTATGDIASTDTINTALSKLENKAANISVGSSDKTVTVQTITGAAFGTDLAVNIDGTTLVKNTTSGVISSDLKIVKNSSPSDTSVKEEYYLAYGSSSTAIGDTIKIYKDSALLSIKLLHAYHVGQTGEILPTYSNGTWTDIDSQYQTEENVALCYAYSNATGATVIAAVPVGDFLQESEFGDGLQVVSGEVSVKIDSTSEDFLSVSSNGVKVSGVSNAIATAIADLDATPSQTAGDDGLALSLTEVDGVVTAISGSIAANTYDAYGAAAAAVAALDATVSQAAAADNGQLALSVTETDGVITAISGSIAANTYDAYGAASTAETNAKVYTDTEITKLDVTDTAVANQFVTSVSETDGKISVQRAQPAAAGVSIADAGGYFTATDVEAALAELATFNCGEY